MGRKSTCWAHSKKWGILCVKRHTREIIETYDDKHKALSAFHEMKKKVPSLIFVSVTTNMHVIKEK